MPWKRLFNLRTNSLYTLKPHVLSLLKDVSLFCCLGRRRAAAGRRRVSSRSRASAASPRAPARAHSREQFTRPSSHLAVSQKQPSRKHGGAVGVRLYLGRACAERAKVRGGLDAKRGPLSSASAAARPATPMRIALASTSVDVGLVGAQETGVAVRGAASSSGTGQRRQRWRGRRGRRQDERPPAPCQQQQAAAAQARPGRRLWQRLHGLGRGPGPWRRQHDQQQQQQHPQPHHPHSRRRRPKPNSPDGGRCAVAARPPAPAPRRAQPGARRGPPRARRRARSRRAGRGRRAGRRPAVARPALGRRRSRLAAGDALPRVCAQRGARWRGVGRRVYLR
jgi:hypothetical protein